MKIVMAKGQYMYDESETRILDCINNVAHGASPSSGGRFTNNNNFDRFYVGQS